jgi:hypothetical protein
MSGPAFTILGDNCNEPLVARAYARTEGLGHPSLAEALKHRRDVEGPKDVFVQRPAEETLAQCYTFPDDTVLLMIGNTQELVDACNEAVAANILAFVTAAQKELQLFYARIAVSSFQTDTLIAITPLGSSLVPWGSSKDSWLEYGRWQVTPGLYGQPTYVTTSDDPREPCALPPIIRWIKQNDDKAWLKA